MLKCVAEYRGGLFGVDSIVNYTRCREKVESCKKSSEEEKMKNMYSNGCRNTIDSILFVISFFGLIGFVGLCMSKTFDHLTLLCGIIGLGGQFFWWRQWVKWIKEKKNNIKNYEAQLSNFEQKAGEAANKFRAVVKPYGIPQDYWYEYAITEMLRYVENGMTDNWKDTVNKYEEHIDRQYVKYSSEANSRGEKVTSKDEWKALKIAGGILGLAGIFLGGALRNAGKDIGR